MDLQLLYSYRRSKSKIAIAFGRRPAVCRRTSFFSCLESDDPHHSPVSSLMTFDKRKSFKTSSATSLMRCGILQPALPFGIREVHQNLEDEKNSSEFFDSSLP
jgi:hypothetical protein